MEEVKSEDNLRSVLRQYRRYRPDHGHGLQEPGFLHNPAAGTVARGYVKVTSSRYVSVYTDATTNNAIQNPGKG